MSYGWFMYGAKHSHGWLMCVAHHSHGLLLYGAQHLNSIGQKFSLKNCIGHKTNGKQNCVATEKDIEK